MGNENKIEEELGRLLEEAKELQESSVTLIYKSSTEEQSLRHRAQSLESSIRRLRTSVDSLLSSKQLDLKLAEKVEEDLQKARCILNDEDAASFLPTKAQGRFLRMFLGPINVRATRKDVQLKVKEEYNSYRIGFELKIFKSIRIGSDWPKTCSFDPLFTPLQRCVWFSAIKLER